MKPWIVLILLVLIVLSILLVAWFRKRYSGHLSVELIDLLIVGFIFALFLLLSGRISSFQVADVKMEIQTTKDEAIDEIKKQQEIAMLWVQVLQDNLLVDSHKAVIEHLQQIILKEKSWQAYSFLGCAYESWAKKYDDAKEKKDGLLLKALDAYTTATELGNMAAALNVANICAYFNQEEKCKEWIQKAQNANKLPAYNDVFVLEYLMKYENKPWFKELKWKEYK